MKYLIALVLLSVPFMFSQNAYAKSSVSTSKSLSSTVKKVKQPSKVKKSAIGSKRKKQVKRKKRLKKSFVAMGVLKNSKRNTLRFSKKARVVKFRVAKSWEEESFDAVEAYLSAVSQKVIPRVYRIVQ